MIGGDIISLSETPIHMEHQQKTELERQIEARVCEVRRKRKAEREARLLELDKLDPNAIRFLFDHAEGYRDRYVQEADEVLPRFLRSGKWQELGASAFVGVLYAVYYLSHSLVLAALVFFFFCAWWAFNYLFRYLWRIHQQLQHMIRYQFEATAYGGGPMLPVRTQHSLLDDGGAFAWRWLSDWDTEVRDLADLWGSIRCAAFAKLRWDLHALGATEDQVDDISRAFEDDRKLEARINLEALLGKACPAKCEQHLK
jgi:hypothetical protein